MIPNPSNNREISVPSIKAVIFDLDGVIVSTDEYHYQAWKKLADTEGIYFDKDINHRLRGVSRMESLEILLKASNKQYSEEQKLELAARKNFIYRELLKNITPDDILPEVNTLLYGLRKKRIKMAIGSSSRNSKIILENIGLGSFFDAVIDGNMIKKSKPDPEVFVKASAKLRIPVKQCLVIEDAVSGISAALAAGMKVVAVGYGAEDKRAHKAIKDLSAITVEEILDFN